MLPVLSALGPALLLFASFVASCGPDALRASTLDGAQGLGERGGSGALHTELLASHPAADTVIDVVDRVELLFSTPVPVGLSRMTVEGPGGGTVPTSRVEHPDPESTDRLVVRFSSPLPPGPYVVRWSTAAPDGHVLADTLAFRVADDRDAAAPSPDPGARVPPPPESAPPAADRILPEASQTTRPFAPTGTTQRWLHLLGTILLVGVVGFRFGALGPAGRKGGLDAVRERAGRGLRRFGWAAAILLLITLFTRLHHQLRELGAGEGLAWEFLPHVLFRTGWGGGWWIHFAVVAMAVIGLVIAARPGAGPRGWGIVAGAAVILPLVPALQGHAMGAELRAMTIPIMYVHVAAAGTWLGGLLMLLLVGVPAVKRFPDSQGSIPPLARIVEAFSRVGLVSVATLAVTGVASIFLYGVGLGELVGTTWGRMLIVKLVVVAAALFLGYHNWRRVQPTLRANPDPGALRIPAAMEAILGIVVLLVTASLVATPLP